MLPRPPQRCVLVLAALWSPPWRAAVGMQQSHAESVAGPPPIQEAVVSSKTF